MKATISAVVLTKNEEKNIEDCLRSLSFVDEIIVIDDESTDKTLTISKKYTNKIYIRPLNNNFSLQRNFGIEKANGQWILFIDADERISPSLQFEITQITSMQLVKYDGYFIKRNDFLWGKELHYGETGNIWILRLARKEAGQWMGRVHETWNIKGRVGKLQNPLLHFPHPTLTSFLEEINYYTDIKAKELFEKKVRINWVGIVLYPLGKFLKNYIYSLGFMDGVRGIIVTLMMSLHSFLVRGKLWLLWNQFKNK